ncbi:hypothetical protein KQH82_12755 [bacterium]|nr:hypothetical protein [bacterium]
MRRMLVILVGAVVLASPTVLFAGPCGDINNDGGVDLSDLIRLVNYLFLGGSSPDCGTETGTVTDIDGNVYKTVRICDQWWMVENLKVTRFSNGDPIPNITDRDEWRAARSGAYSEWNNDSGYVPLYGRIYNFYAASDARNIAPEGWHVPTDAEWKQLEMCLGMTQGEADLEGFRGDQGGKLKQIGTILWSTPNTGATNESGFSAIGTGHRDQWGDFISQGIVTALWTSTESVSGRAWARLVYYNTAEIQRLDDEYEWDGFFIRCVKD